MTYSTLWSHTILMRLSYLDILVGFAIGALLVLCSLFLLLSDADADEYVTAAVGVANSAKSSDAETKFINVGHRAPFFLGLTQQVEGGGWVDIAGHGRRSSGYLAYQLGVETDGPLFARVMTGPALITSPDTYLGGNAQFTEDFYFGLRGQNRNTVGILYKHFSSAGIEQPNVGRDLAGVSVSIPF